MTLRLRPKEILWTLAIACVLCLTLPASTQAKDLINQTFFGGVAIDGYDPVAYFTQGKAVEGSDEYSYDWHEAEWHFASERNMKLFMADPTDYAPQYGGYCAWAVSQGKTAGINPKVFKIVNGKLYLNYSKDTQTKWARDVPGNIEKANRNWPEVLN